MNNSVFGNVQFNTGWKTRTYINLYGDEHNIIVKAKAYAEKDCITEEQERAYRDFNANKSSLMKSIEKLLNDFVEGGASSRFTPRTLLFNRDGGYALLLDDNQDEDDGIAVCIAPKIEVMSQDEYL